MQLTDKVALVTGAASGLGLATSQALLAAGARVLAVDVDEARLQQQFGAIADNVRGGVLSGSDEEIIDRIGQYVEAGADQVNLALRAPFDLESLEKFSAALHLA